MHRMCGAIVASGRKQMVQGRRFVWSERAGGKPSLISDRCCERTMITRQAALRSPRRQRVSLPSSTLSAEKAPPRGRSIAWLIRIAGNDCAGFSAQHATALKPWLLVAVGPVLVPGLFLGDPRLRRRLVDL